jgi:hypothetical protein
MIFGEFDFDSPATCEEIGPMLRKVKLGFDKRVAVSAISKGLLRNPIDKSIPNRKQVEK